MAALTACLGSLKANMSLRDKEGSTKGGECQRNGSFNSSFGLVESKYESPRQGGECQRNGSFNSSLVS